MDKIASKIAIALEVYPAKELFSGEYIKVFERNGYEYISGSKTNNDNYSAILPYEKTDDGIYVYIHNEPRLNHNETYVLVPSCVTGTIEDGESYLENAIKELGEEVGFYNVDESKWKAAGTYYPSKATSEVYHAFLVDVTGLEIKEPKGDGSNMEKMSNCGKYKLEKAQEIVKDAIFHTLVLKFKDNINE